MMESTEDVIAWLEGVKELERRLWTPVVSYRTILEHLGLDYDEEMKRVAIGHSDVSLS